MPEKTELEKQIDLLDVMGKIVAYRALAAQACDQANAYRKEYRERECAADLCMANHYEEQAKTFVEAVNYWKGIANGSQ